mgnify:CR=1 FL=1
MCYLLSRGAPGLPAATMMWTNASKRHFHLQPLSAYMPLDRSPWTKEIADHESLPWDCPYCTRGHLAICEDSLQKGETRDSAEGHEHDAWEPEWIDGRFACLLRCSNCTGKIAVAGKYRVEDNRHYDPAIGEVDDSVTILIPLFFSEAPHIVRLPERTPSKVSDALAASFSLYWHDPDAAANRIRAAVEALLTARGVKQTSGTGRGGRTGRRLTLHQRIELFAAKAPLLADKVMAIKWIGNAGSHSRPLDREDVLDGLEIMEYALNELYFKQRERVVALANTINRRRGPRSGRGGS